MPTIREIYFQLKDIKSPYLNDNVIKSLIMHSEGIENAIDYVKIFENECKNPLILMKNLQRVVKGEPYQYVINSAIFNGLDFYVDNRVLIPRNETEELFLKVSNLIKKYHLEKSDVFDFCTGSGVLAISLSSLFKNLKVVGSDVSSDALEVAKLNNRRLNTNVGFLLGDKLEPVLEKSLKFDVLVSNPPYIKSEESVDSQVLEHEPHLALFSYPYTLFYETVFKEYKNIMKDKYLLAFEIGEDMEEDLTSLINKYFENVNYYFEKDMYNKTRFLFIINL